MKTTTITVKEYAKAYGCTPRYVNQMLNDGHLLTGMVSYRKTGGTWLISVLSDWYEKK